MTTFLFILAGMIAGALLIVGVSVATAYYILKDPMLQDPKRGDRQ